MRYTLNTVKTVNDLGYTLMAKINEPFKNLLYFLNLCFLLINDGVYSYVYVVSRYLIVVKVTKICVLTLHDIFVSFQEIFCILTIRIAVLKITLGL